MVVAQITGKTDQVILDHYLGIDESIIQREMKRAFGGSPNYLLNKFTEFMKHYYGVEVGTIEVEMKRVFG